MSGDLIEMLEQLPERETKRLAELEVIVRKDLKAFLRVGSALAEISNSRLYRSEFLSFEEYMASKWDLSRPRGYQLIDAHIVNDQLSTIVDSQPLLFAEGAKIVLPVNEAQIRPLVKYKDDPEKLAQIWAQAIETAPQGTITAKHVQQTLFDVVGKTTKDNTGTRRSAINKDELLEDDFKKSFNTMLNEIDRARIGKYKKTSREAILSHLDALRDIVANDGTVLADFPIRTQADRNKLLNGGFRIFRKNQENLCIEEQTGSGLWDHHEKCESPELLSDRYNNLMREDNHLRG